MTRSREVCTQLKKFTVHANGNYGGYKPPIRGSRTSCARGGGYMKLNRSQGHDISEGINRDDVNEQQQNSDVSHQLPARVKGRRGQTAEKAAWQLGGAGDKGLRVGFAESSCERGARDHAETNLKSKESKSLCRSAEILRRGILGK